MYATAPTIITNTATMIHVTHLFQLFIVGPFRVPEMVVSSIVRGQSVHGTCPHTHPSIRPHDRFFLSRYHVLMSTDLQHMRRAIALAKRGQGRVEPNPMVGAVLVRDGQVLAEGYHHRFGAPHAEVDALNRCAAAGRDPAAATFYVNLEPCCHHAKTPPCTDAIIHARIAQVYVAMVDPDPRVAGRGIDNLRRANIHVDVGLCQQDAAQLNAPFIKRTTTGLPWIIAKWAQTLDGAIATRTGHSQWISGERSRHIVHQLRARADAIIVGIGTALADDPLLTARDVPVRRTARRVVIDPNLRLPIESRLVQSLAQDPHAAPVTIATARTPLDANPSKAAELKALGVECLALPAIGHSAPLDLEPLMRHLAQVHQATNVLVEGGTVTFGNLLRQGLIDQILAFVCPRLAADASARTALAGLDRPSVDQFDQLHLGQVRRLGDDIMLDYRFTAPPTPA